METMSRRSFIQATAGAAALGPSVARASQDSVRAMAGFRGSLCFFSKHLPRMNGREVGRTLKAMGFDGVDLTVRPGGHVDPTHAAIELPVFVDAVRHEGLSVPMITTELLSDADPAAQPTLETAARLKIPFFKPGYYRYKFVDPRKEREEAGRQLKGLADLTRRHGMRLGYHNHAGYIGGPVWDFASFIEPLDAGTVGYYFDVRHAVVEGGDGGWRTAFDLVAPRLSMIALKDFFWEKKGSSWTQRNCPIGEGMVDWKRYFAMLATARFHGPVSLHIEYEIAGDTPAAQEKNTLVAAARDFTFVKARIAEAYAGAPCALSDRRSRMAQKPKRPDVRRRTSKNRVRGQSVTPSTQRRRSRAGAAASDGTQEAADFYATLLAKGAGTPFLLSQPKDVELGKVIKVIATDVLDYVRPRFEGDPIGELLRPERIVVTTVPQAPVQAVTVWMAPRHAIVVNLGLMLFMYRFARAASPHIIIRSETDPPAPPESEAISIIAALIDFMSSRVRAPLVRDWPAGPRETKTAENLTTAGERFVISHEIGHIIFRHLIADARHVDRATASLQDLDVRPLEQEIEADTGGALMAIESLPDPRPGAVGIVMFLHSLRLAESVGAIVPDGTHPTAVERMNTLWGVLPQRYGAQFATITSWANQLNELLSRLGDAALREREARRRKARQALDTIFREHPSQIVARNYAADRAMIADVQDLYFTVPGAVIDAVTGNLLDARQLQATSLSEDSFRRHRLALFIAHHLMPPAVRAALGISI